MALSYETLCAIPRLQTYEDAERHERHVKPIRGDKNNIKPLGRRSQKHIHIRRDNNGDICIHYGWGDGVGFELVRYRPDGDVLLTDQQYWNKASANEIITEVTGIHVSTYQGMMWVDAGGRKSYLRPAPKPKWDGDRGVWIHPDPAMKPENIFRREADGTRMRWVYVNPPTMTVHRVNRRGAKAVRARYVEALTYIEALTKLRRDDRPENDELQTAFPDKWARAQENRYSLYYGLRELLPVVSSSRSEFTHEHAAELCALMASSDPFDQYRAYLWLHRHTVASDVMKNADRVLMMHHYDEMLEKREVETTNNTHDRYVWAVPPQGKTA